MIYVVRIPRTLVMMALLLGAMAVLTALFVLNIGYYSLTSPSWHVALARAGRKVEDARLP